MARLGNHNRKSRAAFAAAAVFLAVAAILFGVLLHFYRDASPSPSPNGTPQETATESAGGRESEFPTVDWDYWKSVNGDVIGWITVPGTDINHAKHIQNFQCLTYGRTSNSKFCRKYTI